MSPHIEHHILSSPVGIIIQVQCVDSLEATTVDHNGYFLSLGAVRYVYMACELGCQMCGESWLAVKDSLTHRPSSQGWASVVSLPHGHLYSFCVCFICFLYIWWMW